MRLNKILFIGIFFMLSTPLCAQLKLSLKQAILDSWNNRKNIQAGKLDINIQQLKTDALLKKYEPQVNLEYNYQLNPILQSSIVPVGKFNPSLPDNATARIQFGTTWSQFAGATVTQPLINTNTGKQITENRLQQKIAAATQAQTTYDLAYDVAKAYINIYLQQQSIQSAAVDSSRSWTSYELQLQKSGAGRLLKSDLNKAKINHNNAVQKVQDAIIQLVENKVLLLYLTGHLSDSANDVEIDTGFFRPELLQMTASPKQADSIPKISQLRMQQELALAQQQTEKSRYLPTLDLKGFIGANQYTNHFNPIEANTWYGYSYLGVFAKWPLLFGEDRQRKLKQLNLQYEQFGKQREDQYSQYAQQSATAKLELQRLEHQLRTLEENLQLSRESVSIIQDRVNESQETASALNTEELELQRVVMDYDNIKRQLWLYWLDYLKSSGLLLNLWK